MGNYRDNLSAMIFHRLSLSRNNNLIYRLSLSPTQYFCYRRLIIIEITPTKILTLYTLPTLTFWGFSLQPPAVGACMMERLMERKSEYNKKLNLFLRTQILLVVQLKMECEISSFVEFH